MEATIEFSPGILIPAAPLDIQKRIQELRGYLDPNNPNYHPEPQHINIKAAIKLYEDGKIDGVEQVFIMDGKVVSKEEMFRGSSWSWSEGIWHQYAQKHAYGHGDFGANFHEVSIGLCLNARSSNFLLQIRMLLKLTPRLGVMERSTA
jgi:hypothetical protein